LGLPDSTVKSHKAVQERLTGKRFRALKDAASANLNSHVHCCGTDECGARGGKKDQKYRSILQAARARSLKEEKIHCALC